VTLSTVISDTRKAVTDNPTAAQALFSTQGTLTGVTGVDVRTATHSFTVDEPPAIYDSAISVGATLLDDTIASFSSVGPVMLDGSNRLKPDLMAPGVALRTAAPSNAYAESFTGTSGSSPQVAGAIALLWSALPELAGDVGGTEQALELGAVQLRLPQTCGGFSGEDVPNPFFGWGRLDVEAAFESAAANSGLRTDPFVLGHHPSPRPLAPRP